ALLTVQFFREWRDPRPHNPALPSCLLEPARLSYLLDISFAVVCSDTTPFIAVLIEAATGRHSV
ncbi:MAG: hypothetical protein WBC72_11645, partial [Pseudolabrys sp.]